MTARLRVLQGAGVLVVSAVLGAATVQVVAEVRRDLWELGGGTVTDREIDEAREALAGRVPFEEVQGTARAVLDETLAALEVEVGPVVWDVTGSSPVTHGGACTEAEWEAEGTGFDDWLLSDQASATGAVALTPDAAARAAEVVAHQARLHGFADQDVSPRGAGVEHVTMRTVRGGDMRATIGEGAVSVSVMTDCYLTASRLADLS